MNIVDPGHSIEERKTKLLPHESFVVRGFNTAITA